MQIQLTTDNYVENNGELKSQVEAVVEKTLKRFGDRITRVEVHLTDENSDHKGGSNDKRCVMEARLGGLKPIAVKSEAATVKQAIDSAADKLRKSLDHTLGKLGNHKGLTPAGGEHEI